MKKTKNFLLVLIIPLCFSYLGCFDEEIVDVPSEVIGLSPIYDANQAWKNVEITDGITPQDIDRSLRRSHFSFGRELNQGVHVFDLDAVNPSEPIAFLSIPNLHDFDIDRDTLIVGNFLDRIKFLIADSYDIKIISRDVDYYSRADYEEIPRGHRGYFYCPDPMKGDIVGWEEVLLFEPQCWR